MRLVRDFPSVPIFGVLCVLDETPDAIGSAVIISLNMSLYSYYILCSTMSHNFGVTLNILCDII